MTTETDQQAADRIRREQEAQEAQIQTTGDIFAVLGIALMIIIAIVAILARLP